MWKNKSHDLLLLEAWAASMGPCLHARQLRSGTTESEPVDAQAPVAMPRLGRDEVGDVGPRHMLGRRSVAAVHFLRSAHTVDNPATDTATRWGPATREQHHQSVAMRPEFGTHLP
jgi:hypothetical protein